mmetsp:Transcript_381/g.817  ORF Transcript_381/g.817 Transcript_381/m.817 type:complete len:304 (+) Transcript_381:56-967(+)
MPMAPRRQTSALLTVVFASASLVLPFSCSSPLLRTKPRMAPSSLFATDDTSKSARSRGIYSRPSAAIERGSGFFIPGLEGSKIRFLFGITAILAEQLNHALVPAKPGDWGQVVAESLSLFYGVFLLLQGTIELSAEGKWERSSGESAVEVPGTRSAFVAECPAHVSPDVQREVQRTCEAVLNYSPAIFVTLANTAGSLYTLGYDVDSGDTPQRGSDEEKKLIQTCLDAASQSKGGRVALPEIHPASKLLPKSATRCILVQRVGDVCGSEACLIIGSDRLLPSFTRNDLRWIGQLADFTNLRTK